MYAEISNKMLNVGVKREQFIYFYSYMYVIFNVQK